jgi:hypothetical protein
MTTGQSESALRDEIRVVEGELTELRRTVIELRTEIGGKTDGPSDPEDTTALLTSVEEQEAVIGILEARRDKLQSQLPQS